MPYIEQKFNCPYCHRPIVQTIDPAFPQADVACEPSPDVVDPPVAGGYRGGLSEEAERVARREGADPDRLSTIRTVNGPSIPCTCKANWSGRGVGITHEPPCYYSIEQTGAGFAEPVDDSVPVVSPYALAREMITTWVDGKDRITALRDIDNREAAHAKSR